MSGTGIGTIFVDHLLRLLRFTPISALINLIETDVGRPVDQIRSNLAGYDPLAADVKEVLESLVPKELEVQANTGEWYLLRIRPYRTLENVIEGTVITFTEISTMKKAQAVLRDSEALRRLAVVVRDASDAILVQDLTGRILAWNPAAERMYGWSEAEALAMNIRDLTPKSEREHVLAAFRQKCQASVLEPQPMITDREGWANVTGLTHRFSTLSMTTEKRTLSLEHLGDKLSRDCIRGSGGGSVGLI